MSRDESIPVQETSPPSQPAVPGGKGGSPADMGPSANPLSKLEATPPMKQQLPELELVTIPSYSRWFNWQSIHECEGRLLPEFFDQTSSKNPTVYKYYRNSIVDRFRRASLATSGSGGGSSGRKITFTEVRRTIVGDVGSIRRVFDFLESWGLINYSPSTHPPAPSSSAAKLQPQQPTPPPQPPADLAGISAESGPSNAKRLCSGCKSLCSIACFVCDKYDLVLCARCYVRGNYRVGVNSSEFRRVEISETAKTDWTDKETLHLLEGLMHYGDDWMRVAEHVGGRTEKECVARFIKLPFGEQYANDPSEQVEEDSMPLDHHGGGIVSSSSSVVEPSAKRTRLTPLADASNPIMAQAAFLSALAGADTAEAAASAAVTAFFGIDSRRTGAANGQSSQFVCSEVAASGGALMLHALEEAEVGAESLLKEDDVERIISDIAQVQMKEIQDKVVLYEAMDLQLEKEWQHLYQMKHQLFLDQLALLFHKKHIIVTPKSGENAAEEPDRTH